MAVVNYEIIPNSTNQFSSSSGDITLDPTNIWVGWASFLLGAAGTINIVYGSIQGIADAGNGHIIEFGFSADDTVPGAGEAYDFYRSATLNPFTNLAFGFATDGTMYVSDDAGVVRGTGTTILTPDTKYNIAFYYEVASGTAGKLGPVYLAQHGQAYAEEIAQGAGFDTFDAAAPYEDRFLHNTFGTPPPQNHVSIGWIRHISGATSISDMMGPPGAKRSGHPLSAGSLLVRQ